MVFSLPVLGIGGVLTTPAAAAPILLPEATAEKVRSILAEGTAPATARAHAGDLAYFWSWAAVELGTPRELPPLKD